MNSYFALRESGNPWGLREGVGVYGGFFAAVQGGQLRQGFVVEGEVEDAEVFALASGVLGLRDGDRAELQVPAEDDLRRGRS